MSAATFWRVSNGGWADYLDHAMGAAGFANAADLSRAAGVDQTQISRWLRGVGQPSVENLRKLAPVLKVPLLRLLVEAGHITRAEAGLRDVPAPAPATDIPSAVENASDLIDEAKRHLLSQYELLRRLSDPAGTKKQGPRPLPAAARRVRRPERP